jgi:GTP cyclohydrolase III
MLVGHFDGDDIGPALELMLLDNQIDLAREYSETLSRALLQIRDFLEKELGAEVIICGGDDLIACWNDGSVTSADIKDIRAQFFDSCGRTMSVGIGSTSREATQNLRRAKLLGKDRAVSTIEGLG